MRFLSVCSGIEAASCAWEPLGWKAHAFAEIEAFPSAVLAHHYSDTPNWGDMTKFQEWPDADIDVLVGGTPCQSFSVAGLRKGLADPRGNLALTFLAIAAKYSPRYIVWENVPGVLSSGQGRDFGAFLGGLGQCGYGWAYRVLDAQYFGVPQRRRRVFVVGHLGDWRRAAAVLLERHSLSGHPAPRREKGQNAPTIPSRGSAGGGLGTDFDCDGGLVANTGEVAACLVGHPGRTDWETETFVAHSLRGEGFDASEDGTGRGTPLVPVGFNITPSNSNRDYNAREASYSQALTAGGNRPSARGGDLIVGTLTSNGDAHSGFKDEQGLVAVAFQQSQSGFREHDTHATLDANNGSRRHNGVAIGSAVRRLTPRECERLQGFPDDYTLIPYRGKPAADGPRYKALGNSMAVPVMQWIGERIQLVEQLQTQARAA